MSSYSTGNLYDMILRCDDPAYLKNEILTLLKDQREMWQAKIGEILSDTGYSVKEFAALCQVSEPTVRKWCKGSLPQSRDMYLRIGFAAGFSLEQMNSFLQRYGRCPQLYVKSLEDSICIFVLRSDTLPRTYATYRQLLDLVQERLCADGQMFGESYSTGKLSSYVENLDTADEMVEFARSNAGSYRDSYARLYNFILAYLRINRMDREGERLSSVHALQEETGWSSSLRHCISEIRNRRWIPLRHKVISLGLHLNMDTEDINTMLQLAQMEILCARNPVEAVVIYAVEDAKLNNLIFADGSNELCDYVKTVLSQMELSDGEYLIDDL